MKIKNFAVLLTTTPLLLPGAALATNGYQLIGVGAYQKSLGGAVTANPGSAMTAVSNPAGSARVGQRADFSMEAFMPDRSVDFSATGGVNAESGTDLYGVPAIGWTAPTSEGSDIYFGGGMYGTSGMGVDYAPEQMLAAHPLSGNPVYWDGYSNIAFWQMAPTLAWNVDSRLSLGASLNIDYQSVSFRQRTMQDTTGDGVGDSVASNFDLGRSASAFGFGASFGLLYDVSDTLTVGASYKSKQQFSSLEYQLAAGDISHPDFGGDLPAGTYKLDLDYPQQAAAGIAWEGSPALTLSADVKWINWSDTMDKLSVEGPVDYPMDPGWDDQVVYAVGIAYAASPRLNLRAGYNYAESPFGDRGVSRNLILPAVVESHYTIGGDYRFNRHWELGFHYMVAPEVTYTASATDPDAPGTTIALEERSFGLNIGYRF